MNYVYILTNASRTVLYIGITNNLPRRLYEHKHELVDGFTKTYHVHELMYAEPHPKKNHLIMMNNPNWIDLSKDWLS